MPTYSEMTDAYEVVTSSTGVTATRKFHDDGGPLTELPTIGSRLDSTDTDGTEYEVYCTEIRKTKAGAHPTKHWYVMHYSNKTDASAEADDDGSGTGAEIGDTSNVEDLPVSGSIGVDVITIKKEIAELTWKWTVGDVAYDDTIALQIFTANISVTKVVKTLDLDSWSKKVGKICDGGGLSVRGVTFAAGTALFTGAPFSEYRNQYNQHRWKVNFNFSIKQQGANNVGWNYLYNSKTGAWDMPYVLVGASRKYLFESAALGKMLSGT